MDIRVYDIQWDTDGQDPADLNLPNDLTLSTAAEGIENPAEDLSDWLSDKYGWCVSACSYETVAKNVHEAVGTEPTEPDDSSSPAP